MNDNPPTPSSAGIVCSEEDHEKYAGEVIPDPWDDPEQTDWPDNSEEAD